ncbi:MAG: TetR/AcrR family transcriptional regulator [Bacteroidota bacterium]
MSKANRTRKAILAKAFTLVYKNGYQATSIDDIVATTDVTKGALYYHFRNKEEMGLAMIQEILAMATQLDTIRPLDQEDRPEVQVYGMMARLLQNKTFFKVEYGCPIVNLTEEMAPLNNKFAAELRKLVIDWQQMMVSYLEQAKTRQTIRPDINSEEVATFVIAGYAGARNLGKVLGYSAYDAYLNELKHYLTLLR